MTAATQRRPRRSLYVGLILAAAVGGAAYRLFRPHFDLTASSAASADPRPVPVTTGVVEIQDFPIYRIGVGTVQAYNTVTVRVRVDGEIQTIAFREGQDVPAISLRKLIRARRRLSCIRRRR
jgi:multidrug efflux system membrane fusion protein